MNLGPGHTYVIADLHGRVDLLNNALRVIAENDPGTVVFLGDYVDRGPWSKQVIDRIMAGPPDGWKWVPLLGNHETMMLEVCALPHWSNIKWWLGNGGGQTLLSYGHPVYGKIYTQYVDPSHLAFFRAIDFTYEDDHRIYVHAGMKNGKERHEHTEQELVWDLYDEPLTNNDGWNGKHVVHGHHQFSDGPIMLQNRTNLDTFAWFTGRLVVGVFKDDQPGGMVHKIEIIGRPYDTLDVDDDGKPKIPD